MSLPYAPGWLRSGFALSEDLPLNSDNFVPRDKDCAASEAWLINILMDNTDDHEKNHALLRQADGHYRLSPAFDVWPSAQGLGHQAMTIGDLATESTIVNALSQARQFGLKPDAAHAILREIASGVAGWKEAFAAKGVSAHNIELLAQYIDGARLRGQRDEFSRV